MPKLVYAILHLPSDSAATDSLIGEVSGISGNRLYLVSQQNISALTSNCSNGKEAWTKENALIFAHIIETFSEKYTLLPVRFPTLVESDEVITGLLKTHFLAFENNLKMVENKSEFGLKVLWDYDKVKAEIKNKPEVTGVKSDDYFSKNSVTTNYLFEKIKKHKLDDAILNFVDEFIESLNIRLKLIPYEAKFKKMVSDTIMLDAVFLIGNEHHGQIKEVVIFLGEQYSGLQFLVTGPWPPYSFTEVKIE